MADETPQPTDDRLTKHHTVLYGGNGGGGLVLQVKEDHEMRLRKLEVGQAKLIMLSGLVCGFISAALAIGATYAIKAIGG
jgi:hypothetical protein